MEERGLNFNINEDKTIVNLTDKQLKDYKANFSHIALVLNQINSKIDDNTLEEGYKETLLKNLHNRVIDMLDVLGYETILKKENEERYKEIKSINTENRELRRQLGEKVSNEDMREKLKNLSKITKDWWRKEGFGHISEISYSENGYVKLKLSGHIFDDYDYDEATGTKKSDYLISKGFEVSVESRSGGSVIDNDNNKKLLEQLLLSKYPSSDIVSITNWKSRNSDNYDLRDIEVMIYNLEDIK